MSTVTRRTIPAIIVAGLMALTMTGCVAGEGSTNNDAPAEGSEVEVLVPPHHALRHARRPAGVHDVEVVGRPLDVDPLG